jgi:hypothetical protein
MLSYRQTLQGKIHLSKMMYKFICGSVELGIPRRQGGCIHRPTPRTDPLDEGLDPASSRVHAKPDVYCTYVGVEQRAGFLKDRQPLTAELVDTATDVRSAQRAPDLWVDDNALAQVVGVEPEVDTLVGERPLAIPLRDVDA